MHQDFEIQLNRLNQKLQLQDEKMSQLSLQLSQRNEDIFNKLETFTPQKQLRESIQQLRSVIETKQQNQDDQLNQIQNYITKQISTFKQEVGLHIDNHNTKLQKFESEFHHKNEIFHSLIQQETKQEIQIFISKAAQMEDEILKLFEKKQKLLEKISLTTEGNQLRLNLIENTLSQHSNTLQQLTNRNLSYQTNPIPNNHFNNTPSSIQNYSSQKKQYDTAQELIKRQERQEDVLQTLCQSIFNLEKRIVESDQKQKRDELSFDQLLLSNRKPKEQQEQIQETKHQPQPPSDDYAKTLNPEAPSPLRPIEGTEISLNPQVFKQSPKPYPAMPSPNSQHYEIEANDYEKKLKQMQKDYEDELKQLNQQQMNLQQQQQQFSDRKSEKKKTDDMEKMGGKAGIRGLLNRQQSESFSMRDSNLTVSQMQDSGTFSRQGKNLKQSSGKKELPPVNKGRLGSVGRQQQKQTKRNVGKQQKDEDDEIVYQLDEDGYLMDEEGNYLLDENEQYIQIGADQLDELRKQNLIEEEIY